MSFFLSLHHCNQLLNIYLKNPSFVGMEKNQFVINVTFWLLLNPHIWSNKDIIA